MSLEVSVDATEFGGRVEVPGIDGLSINPGLTDAGFAQARKRNKLQRYANWALKADGSLRYIGVNSECDFHWKHPRKSLFFVQKLMFWD